MEPNIVSTDTLTIVGFHDVPCQILEGKSMIWTRVFDRKPHFVKLYHAIGRQKEKEEEKKQREKNREEPELPAHENDSFGQPLTFLLNHLIF